MAQTGRLAAASMAILFFLAVPVARSQSADASLTLPDNPSPQVQHSDSQNSPAQQTGSAEPAGQSSSTQTPPATPPQTAAEQLKQQEKQRILGVMATFNTTQNHDALPLSPGQKYQLFFKSVTDPWPFALTAVVAGISQADDDFSAYGQGMEGYAKRYGAAYTDYFTGNFFGNAVLPSLLHEDPRYYQRGKGKFITRALWAAGSTGWCKRDNGTWGPNYSNVAGNLIGAAISNVYYPDQERTVGDTIQRGITVTVEGAVGAELIEFWPDIAGHYKRKKAEKLAREAAQKDAQGASHPESQTPATPAPASH
ncbi:MAG TPA: hypothetical protein VMV98_06005 [Acidobacteriaceae bacterium]|nr:hypothetical protein [Acidobacteriaceae bacterium]